MSYRTYALWMKPTAQCAECGAFVRLRGFWTMFGIGVGALSMAIGAMAAFPSIATGVGVALALSLALMLVDYCSFHVLVWESDHKLAVPDDDLLDLTSDAGLIGETTREPEMRRHP